jgi:hypothetical protein
MAKPRRSESGTPPVAVEFDTFRVAVGLAIIAGAFALVATYLDSLAAALAALAAAGWAAGLARERGGGGARIGAARTVGLVSVALGATAFFLVPRPLDLARGLFVGLAWLPMWWVERHPHPVAVPPRRIRS